ncbi:hypothetical protein HDU79_003102 [Rhizoclosmatium sp. JEL0117]|nr:hypothetical protein HDU79_003102 [Rhizoclosmatium sp. JEL0117]
METDWTTLLSGPECESPPVQQQFNPQQEPDQQQQQSQRTAILPCDDCKVLRKKCDRLLPCTRCVKRKVSCCTYRGGAVDPNVSEVTRIPVHSSPEAEAPSVTSSPAPPSDSSLAQEVRAISQRLAALEANVATIMRQQQEIQQQQQQQQHQGYGMSWQLEDPDLQPTMSDWVILMQYLSHRNYNVLNFLGGRNFLDTFFHEPATIRLTFLAIASHRQQLPAIVCLSYYKRATKLLLREMEKPLFSTFQSLLLMASFTVFNGQPYLGERYFKQACHQAVFLRLIDDPDVVPHLANLTHAQKEERRIAYFSLSHSVKSESFEVAVAVVQIAVSQEIPGPFQGNRVKFASRHGVSASEVYFGQPPVATVCYLCLLLDVVHPIVMAHAKAPDSVEKVLNNPPIQVLHQRLLSLLYQIPMSLILLQSDDLFAINSLANFTSDYNRNFVQVIDVVLCTITFHAANCALYRPQFYLSGFLELDSPHLVNSPDNVGKILAAIDACVSSARIIAHLASWVFQRSSLLLDNDLGKFRATLWNEHSFYAMMLFEAVVCLWFATCRTKQYWWRNDMTATNCSSLTGESLRMTMDDRRLIRSQVLDILQTLKDLEIHMAGVNTPLNPPTHYTDYIANMITPLVRCTAGILSEMESVEQELMSGTVSMNENTSGDNYVLGFKVMSLVEEDEIQKPFVDPPWVLLGLLGVDVRGGLRWMGNDDEKYRALWATC